MDGTRADLQRFAALLDTEVKSCEVVNYVCSGDVGACVDLSRMTRNNVQTCSWEPELFPAMYYRPKKSTGPTFALFSSGKYFITGVKNLSLLPRQIAHFKILANMCTPLNK